MCPTFGFDPHFLQYTKLDWDSCLSSVMCLVVYGGGLGSVSRKSGTGVQFLTLHSWTLQSGSFMIIKMKAMMVMIITDLVESICWFNPAGMPHNWSVFRAYLQFLRYFHVTGPLGLSHILHLNTCSVQGVLSKFYLSLRRFIPWNLCFAGLGHLTTTLSPSKAGKMDTGFGISFPGVCFLALPPGTLQVPGQVMWYCVIWPAFCSVLCEWSKTKGLGENEMLSLEFSSIHFFAFILPLGADPSGYIAYSVPML